MCTQIGPNKILRDSTSAFFRLPGDAGSMLGIAPRRICFSPGLHVFCGPLPIGDLIPPDGVARSVVAASQGNCQKASGCKNEASHNFKQNSMGAEAVPKCHTCTKLQGRPAILGTGQLLHANANTPEARVA